MDGCVVTALSAQPSIRVAAVDAIDARNAPVPSDRTERFLFAQLYETLVRVRCDGTPMPGLAISWFASPDGLTWSFRLRDGIEFTDGTPLDARGIAASWSRAPHVPSLAGVTASGESELHVRLHEPQQDVTFLAQPALAVTRAAAGSDWPLGTGLYRPESGEGGLRLVRRRPERGAPDTLLIVRVPAKDPRSALDSGVDLLVTGDAATIAYARLLDDYATSALPWNRTYTLVTRGGITHPGPSIAERTALAGDAAPLGTRAAMDEPMACSEGVYRGSAPGGVYRAPAPAGTPAHIAYPRGDDIARGIAERIAALSWPAARAPDWLRARMPGGSGATAPLAAVALDGQALIDAMRTGPDAMFVVALHHCSTRDSVHAVLMESGLHATPLVDARDYLIYRSGVGSITVDAFGTARLGMPR